MVLRLMACGVFLFVQSLIAQFGSMRDSIIHYKNNIEPSFTGSLDGRYSYILGKSVDIYGLRIGADYKKFAIYGGMYFTGFQSKYQEKRFSYFYLSGIGEYRWIHNYRWQLNQTAQLGVGMANLEFKDSQGETTYSDHIIIPVEIGANATYRIWKFLGISGGVGARISVIPGSYFSAPYYTAGLAFFPDALSDWF
ncbi:MAG: hypothetical protein ACON5K_02995 [Bacteroidia bacterium]|jgi:hypothetical protein